MNNDWLEAATRNNLSRRTNTGFLYLPSIRCRSYSLNSDLYDQK